MLNYKKLKNDQLANDKTISEEWLELLQEVIESGISKEEFRRFLDEKKEILAKNNEIPFN